MTWNAALNKAVQSGEAKMEVVTGNTGEPTDFNFPQNIFTVENQETLSNLIHHPNTNCPGDCPTCRKFHNAVNLAHTAATEMNIVLSLTENAKPIGSTYGYFQVWCAECSDGENNTFWECCDWAERHAIRRHNVSK